MRPEKAYRVIKKVMSEWYSVDNDKLFIYDKLFVEALDKMIEKSIIEMKDDDDNNIHSSHRYIDDYPDYNIKVSIESYESWRSEMFYISDRWGSFHRLMWLKNGIENNLFV